MLNGRVPDDFPLKTLGSSHKDSISKQRRAMVARIIDL